MTQLGKDTFTRANQSGWGTATDGQVWTMPIGTGTVSIASNEGTIVSNQADTDMQLGSGTYTDMEMLCRASISNTNDIIGFEGRFSSSGGVPTSYKFLFYSGGVHINKGVSGNNFNLVNATVTVNINTFYWYRFKIVGTGLYGKVWQDGTVEPNTWTLQTTDSSIASGGIALLGNTGTASNSVSFDSFYIVDYVLEDNMTISDISTSTILFIPSDTLNITEVTKQTLAMNLQDILGLVDVSIPLITFFSTDILISNDNLNFSTVIAGNILNYMVTYAKIRSGIQVIPVR